MDDVTAIAFYLPQFHPTHFNDVHWSPGFTEWTNVAQGRPLFDGHQQPKIPGELGFYDLRHRPIFEEQIALAQTYKLFGFCFYYYRFGGQRELDLPVRSLLSSPQPKLPFCLCWANESWTRAWDGRSDEVIKEVSYSEETLDGLVKDLANAMSDHRYIRLGSKPLFLIYQLEYVPQPTSKWISELRERIRTLAHCDILLGAVHSHKFTREMSKLVDVVIQFPPHRVPRKNKRELIQPSDLNPFNPERHDHYESYESVVKGAIDGADIFDNLVPGVCPDWDNSVRRPKNAHVLVGSTPQRFSSWVADAARVAVAKAQAGKLPHPLLFVNAWNEWGEGAALEPSLINQRAYLEAFRDGVTSIENG